MNGFENEHEQNLRFLIEEHLEWMKAGHYADETVTSRRRIFRRFLVWLSANNVLRAADLTRERIEGYLRYLTEEYRKEDGEKLALKTIDSIFAAVFTFSRWLFDRDLVLRDPCAGVPHPRVPDNLPRAVFTPVEAERVFAAVDIETETGLRDRAVLELLYSTGLRRAEAVNLLVSDIREGTVFVREGKGRKDRVLPAGERALFWIRKYLTDARPHFARLHAARKTADPGYLFLSQYGQKLAKHCLTKVGRKYISLAGVEKPGSCHVFRHTAATLMLENGADIRHVQELLGHAGPATTSIYTRVAVKTLRETHTRTHPAGYRTADEQTGDRHTFSRYSKLLVHALRPGETRGRQRVFAARETPAGELGRLMEEYTASEKYRYAEEWPATTRRNLWEFITFAGGQGITRPADVTLKLIEEFRRTLLDKRTAQGKPLSIGTQARRLISIRYFFRRLFERGLILTDPAAKVKLPRMNVRLPAEVLTADEVEKVLSVPDHTRSYGLRDRALLELLYATGARGLELVSVRIPDLNFDNHTVFIRKAKGGRQRVVPAGPRAMGWVRRYLEEVRPELLTFSRDPENDFVFLGAHGEPMTRNLAGHITGRCLRAAGVRKNGGCHLFRHTAATIMLENGADLRIIQEFLGHKDLQATQIYTRVGIRRLKEVHARTHPAELWYARRIKEQAADAVEIKPQADYGDSTGSAEAAGSGGGMPA